MIAYKGLQGESNTLTDGLANIIAQLERQMTAIEKALAALREVEGIEAPAPPATEAPRKGPVKNRRSEGQKRRWAAKKVAESAPVAVPEKAAPNRRLTPAGRKSLAESMKRRWAVKRAAGKKRGPKKAV
jgi:hypothetical protein